MRISKRPRESRGSLRVTTASIATIHTETPAARRHGDAVPPPPPLREEETEKEERVPPLPLICETNAGFQQRSFKVSAADRRVSERSPQPPESERISAPMRARARRKTLPRRRPRQRKRRRIVPAVKKLVKEPRNETQASSGSRRWRARRPLAAHSSMMYERMSGAQHR